MMVCHHKKKVNNSCSFLVLSFTTRDEVEIDLLKPGPCAVSARKSQALPAPWGGVSGAGRISKTDLLSQGKETLVYFSFLSSHREHSSLFPPQRQMPWGWVVWSDTGRGGCSSVPSRWAHMTLWGEGGKFPPLAWPYRSQWFPLQMRSKVHARLWSTRGFYVNKLYPYLRDWWIPTPHVNSVAIFFMRACVWPALCQRAGLLCSREEEMGGGTQED